MLKNKNFNYAILIFVITLTVLFAFVEYYPADELTGADAIESNEMKNEENMTITSN